MVHMAQVNVLFFRYVMAQCASAQFRNTVTILDLKLGDV